MFPVIETERLRLRPPVPSDADDLHARRNEPVVARYHDYPLPFSLDQARAMVADADDDGSDGWRILMVTDRETDETYGDVAIGLTFEGRCAEIGFSFAPDQWGNGYATEAAAAAIDHLFAETAVTRILGQLHPANTASARTLERLGFVFEGHTRLSFWVGDENSDDWVYGLTRADHEVWLQRPRWVPGRVELVEIDSLNARSFKALRTHKSQERFVAPVLASYGDALFPEVVDGAPLVPWLRGVVADGEPVGFVMLSAMTDTHPEPYLWRLLVDRLHQRRGVGRGALELVVAQCREWGAGAMRTSWAEGPGSPRRFYEHFGFEPTGELVAGEIEARFSLR
jgi:RimJ/RimL family protein N-acetyltransferase